MDSTPPSTLKVSNISIGTSSLALSKAKVTIPLSVKNFSFPVIKLVLCSSRYKIAFRPLIFSGIGIGIAAIAITITSELR
jgi:hypothetical protein